jgi:hypothetical protein
VVFNRKTGHHGVQILKYSELFQKPLE